MLRQGDMRKFGFFSCFLSHLLTGVVMLTPLVGSVTVPSSNCYALDNNSHLFDFTDWIGHSFEYNGKNADLVVRFCKDVESRSMPGYYGFGHYASYHNFQAGSAHVKFVQAFYSGDLMKCEQSFDKMGRTAEVNIICGNCLNKVCKDDFGCICNISYDFTMCRVFVDLAIRCVKCGPRVFEGFTVGFNPRSWDVVDNGMVQLGYDKSHDEFSFATEQTQVTLYLTAIAVLSNLVGKPSLTVNPNKGLVIKLGGSVLAGSPPTTLSPATLIVNWRCNAVNNTPYAVVVTIPVEGYDPVQFTLTKRCDYSQAEEGDPSKGWAAFGVLSCIVFLLAAVSCCGGFIYKSRIKHLYGLDALPGVRLLSTFLEAASPQSSHPLPEEVRASFINQKSEQSSNVASEGRYRAV